MCIEVFNTIPSHVTTFKEYHGVPIVLCEIQPHPFSSVPFYSILIHKIAKGHNLGLVAPTGMSGLASAKFNHVPPLSFSL